MSIRSVVSPKQNVLQRLSNLLFGREQEKRYGGVVSQEAQEGQNLVSEALRILQPNVSLHHRLNFIKEFCEYIKSYRIESIAVFYAPLADLLDESKNHPIEAYELGFQFMTALIEGQYAQLAPHRPVLFAMINDSDVKALWKYKALTALTNHGRDISPFEVELPNLLVKWLTRFASSAVASKPRDYDESDSDTDTDTDDSDSDAATQYYLQTDDKEFASLVEILQLGTNLMKYNQSHLDEGPRHVLMVKVCTISDTAANVELIVACLNFIDAVVRYGRVPVQTVDTLIATVCRAVNIEAVCEASWKTMNNLLISCGHNGVMALCGLLSNPKNKHTVNLLRGSVFFLGMANWGSQRIQTLDVPPSAILASFLHSLAWKQEIVAYEVILAVRRLVTKYGPDLSMEWDLVLLVLNKIHAIADFHENNLFNMLKETVITIEELAATNQFKGAKAKLEHLSVAFVPFKNEGDVLRTIAIMFEDIHPSSPYWPYNLQHAVEVFFVRDRRTKVRRTVLAAMKRLYDSYHVLCGDELIDKIFLPFLSNIYKDPDMTIRMEALDIVAGVAKGVHSDIYFRLLDIFDKAINIRSNQSDETSMIALSGLLSIFKAKLGRIPSSHALGVWTVAARHSADDDVYTRKTVLQFMGALRATSGHHIKYGKAMSPFLRTVRISVPTPTQLPARVSDTSVFPINHMIDVLLSRLSNESMAELYGFVLEILFGLLRDRYMMADAAASVSKLCDSLCKLLNDRTLGSCVQDYQRDDPRRDGQWILSYEIIGLICGYANPQDDLTHKIVMDTLVAGLFLRPPCGTEARIRIPRVCLGVLSVCAAMLPIKHYSKYLPGILSALSQMSSSSKKNAYSAMYAYFTTEYLGVLVSLPQLTKSLNPPDYESIFRCLLLFIDPGKHQPHVVAMAYRNLVLWFTACDVSIRYSYYALITRSIENVVKDKDSNIGHVVLELLERYVYSDIDPVPSPTKSTSAVFDSATSKTWIQGNSFITVRTGRMGWAEIIMRRPSGCVCWVQQFNFKAPLISDYLNSDNQRVISPTSSLLFPTCVSPTLINSYKTMDRDPFIPISPPTTSPNASPTEAGQRPAWDKLKKSDNVKKISRPSPRLIARSDSSTGFLELDYSLAACIPRTASPVVGSGAIVPNAEAYATRESLSPVTVSSRSSPVGRQLSISDTPIMNNHAAEPEINTYTIPVTSRDDATTPPPITFSGITVTESQLATPPTSSFSDIAESRTETSTPPPDLSFSDVAKSRRSPRGSPLPEIILTAIEDAQILPDTVASPSATRFLARTHANLSLPALGESEGVINRDEGSNTVEAKQDKQGKTEGERESEPSGKGYPLERIDSKKGSFLEFVGKRRSSAISLDLPEGHSALKLSLFYPPLPSYDENELESPSFFASTQEGRTKLDLETQLLLHYGNSPTSTAPTALNTLGFLSPSKRTSSEQLSDLRPNSTPKLVIPDRERGLPDLGVSPREYARLFPPLSPGLGKSQLGAHMSANYTRDASFDVSLNLSADPLVDVTAVDANGVDVSVDDARVDEWDGSDSSPLNVSGVIAPLDFDHSPDLYHHHADTETGSRLQFPNFDLDPSTSPAETTAHKWNFAYVKQQLSPNRASNSNNDDNKSNNSDHSTTLPFSIRPAIPTSPPVLVSTSTTIIPTSVPISIPSSTPVNTTTTVPVTTPTSDPASQLPPIPIPVSTPISTVPTSLLPPTSTSVQTPTLTPSSIPSPRQITPTSTPQEVHTASHALPRLLFPYADKPSPTTSAENSPAQSPHLIRYAHNSSPAGARRIVNFAENQPTLQPRRISTSSENHPAMSRSASEPNIYLASPPVVKPGSPAHHLALPNTHVVPPLPLRAVNTSVESVGDVVGEWDSTASPPTNNAHKGIVTRLRNNSVHFGTLPSRRSPRIYPHATPSSSSSLTTPSSALAVPTSLIPNPSTPTPTNNNNNVSSPPNSPQPKIEHKDVLDPGFVFFHLRQMSFEKAKTLRINDGVERAFNILDRIHIAETHKIGIMYVAPNQTTETEILGNTSGSPRYSEFLRMMGKQVRLRSAGSSDVYTGGLDRSGTTDGKHFVFWEDRVTQVVYHVTTLMPNLENEPLFNNKKRHIGNDFVAIVYSDCPDYKQQIVLGSFNFVQITVYPLTPTHYRVEVMKRLDLPLIGPIIRTAILDHQSLAALVRTTALNANILSILQQDSKSEYVSNLEVRVKQIKTIKDRFAKDTNDS